MVPCIWNTSASPNRALQLLQSLPTSGSAEWKSQLRPPLDDALQCLSFYTFVYTDVYMCAHPEENCFHHSDFYTLEYYWATFCMISFLLWPWHSVRNLAQCSPQRHTVMVENKQDRTARGLALTFQWPPISLHLSLAPPSACFSLSPSGVHWSQVWSHWDVEMCV